MRFTFLKLLMCVTMSSSGFAITVRLQGEVSLDFFIFVKLGITLISYSMLLSYSLFNLENVSLENCILLVVLTYYINRKETFTVKVN